MKQNKLHFSLYPSIHNVWDIKKNIMIHVKKQENMMHDQEKKNINKQIHRCFR